MTALAEPANLAAPPPSWAQRWRKGWPHLAVLVLLGGCSFLLWHQAWLQPRPGVATTVQDPADMGLGVFFIGWAQHALQHGLWPFHTDLMFAGRGGVNLLTNASSLAVGFAVAPISFAFGAIVGTNVAAFAAPVVTGYAMFLALRVILPTPTIQIFGALAWAFAPAVMFDAVSVRLMMSYAFYPPVVLLLLYDLLVRQRWAPRRVGLAFGVVTVVQFFVGTEMLALTALATVVALLAALVLRPRRSAVPWSRIGVSAAWAAAVTLPLLAVPVALAIAGPGAVTGPAWPILVLAHDQVGGVVGRVDLGAQLAGTSGGRFEPNPAFLGWPLLLVVAASATLWRRRVAWVLLVTGGFAWLASLGTAAQRGTSWASLLPSTWLAKLPLLGGLMLPRWSVIVDCCAVVLLALSLQAWWDLAQAHLGNEAWRRPIAVAALTLVALVTVVPELTAYQAVQMRPPHYGPFFAAHPNTALPVGPAYLYPTGIALPSSAQHGFPLRWANGFAVVPGPGGRALSFTTGDFIDQLSAAAHGTGRRPSNFAAGLGTIWASLHRWGTASVVVLSPTAGAGLMGAAMTAALGPARVVAGQAAWVVPPRRPVVRASAAQVVASCAAASPWRGLLAARCVEQQGALPVPAIRR